MFNYVLSALFRCNIKKFLKIKNKFEAVTTNILAF